MTVKVGHLKFEINVCCTCCWWLQTCKAWEQYKMEYKI